MYCNQFKKNSVLYLIIKRENKDIYELVECCFSFDTAIKFIYLYGSSNHLVLKLKLKEVIH